MAQWDKTDIHIDGGETVKAVAPIIISASRSTDIPAFYADWFFDRLGKGYSAWTNPFNGVKSYISYEKTRFIVFWSKNPKPLLKHIGELMALNINCYIQYTLNDYVDEGLEPNVPDVDGRIETFKTLVEKLGKESVIWRFDPLVLTDTIDVDTLLNKITYIGDKLKNYTERLVFSFVDISMYNRVRKNLERDNVHYQEWTEEQMNLFAKRLSKINSEHEWNYQLSTCAEKISLEQYGISHSKCIDDELMIRLAYKDETLMRYLGVNIHTTQTDLWGNVPIPQNAIVIDSDHYAIKEKDNKDKGQRAFCGCIVSKDIGQYNTCPHQCKYCYANTSRSSALANYKYHLENKNSDMIVSG